MVLAELGCSTALTVTGLLLDAVGILVISFPGLFESNRALEQQAGTYWDANPHLGKALFKNRLLLRIGIPMIAVGFLLQAAGALI